MLHGALKKIRRISELPRFLQVRRTGYLPFAGRGIEGKIVRMLRDERPREIPMLVHRVLIGPPGAAVEKRMCDIKGIARRGTGNTTDLGAGRRNGNPICGRVRPPYQGVGAFTHPLPVLRLRRGRCRRYKEYGN